MVNFNVNKAVLVLNILLGNFKLSEIRSTTATGLYHNLGLWLYFLNGQQQTMKIITKCPNSHRQK